MSDSAGIGQRPIFLTTEIKVMSHSGDKGSLSGDAALSSGVEPQEPDRFAESCRSARAGSSQALGELLESCRNYLLLIANIAVKQGLQAKVGASDLVQETFAEAQRIFDRFEGCSENELRRWLAKILEFKIGNTFKRYAAGRRNVHREVGWRDLFGEAFAENLPESNGHSPSSEFRIQEDRERLQAALAALPDDQRAAVRLRVEEGLAFEEIGADLNRSPDAARKLFARAVLRLQHELERRDD